MNEARPFQFEDEDTRLMIQAAAGDRTAYERIYGKYHGTVVAYVRARNGRHGSYEDLVQEVFTRVWEQREKYRPTGPVRAYLLGFAKHILRENGSALSRAVAIRESGITQPEVGPLQPGAVIEGMELTSSVRRHMARLPAPQRQAFELVYVAGLSCAEAARHLGCLVGVVHTNLWRARQQLREVLRDSG